MSNEQKSPMGKPTLSRHEFRRGIGTLEDKQCPCGSQTNYACICNSQERSAYKEGRKDEETLTIERAGIAAAARPAEDPSKAKTTVYRYDVAGLCTWHWPHDATRTRSQCHVPLYGQSADAATIDPPHRCNSAGCADAWNGFDVVTGEGSHVG